MHYSLPFLIDFTSKLTFTLVNMPLQSRPYLLKLPRELRQQVIGYLFDDALAEDKYLNDFLRNELRRVVRFSKLPSTLRELLTRIRWYKFNSARIYAPCVYKVADLLASLHPEMAGDVLFVLSVALKGFEEDQKARMELEYLSKDNNKERLWRQTNKDPFFKDCCALFQARHTTPYQRACYHLVLMQDYGFTKSFFIGKSYAKPSRYLLTGGAEGNSWTGPSCL
jgi:hypothetical protein